MTSYDDVFSALEAAKVRFVVVGGTAVVLQGLARLTVDVDLVVDLAAAPAMAAVEALLSLGLLPRLPVDARDFADHQIRSGWVEHRNLQVFSFHDPMDVMREVDVFAEYPLPFEELYEEASVVVLAGTPVRVASIPHLKAMKAEAGRPQDLEDIAALQRLEGSPDG